MAWDEIKQGGEIGAALALLQATSPGHYTHLTVDILNSKLKSVTQNGDPLWALRLYSYGDLGDPLVSAFFFLRRRKKVGDPHHPDGPDPSGQWAYCLTIGAKDTDDGGLTSDALRDALKDRCLHVKDKYHRPREVMHLPGGPFIKPDNLKQVYAELRTNSQPPKFMDKGPIKLGFPWVPLDASSNEVLKTFEWFEIIEGS
jgi:hypothetical protein